MTNVRAADGKTGASDNDVERLDRHWNVLSLISNPTTYFNFDDYVLVEQIMQLWYANGKIEATGHAYGDSYVYDPANPNTQVTYGDNLTLQCKVFNIPETDHVTHMRVLSGDYGVTNIAVTTLEQSETIIGQLTGGTYAYESINWLRFDNGKQFSGLWGYADPETSKLNAIGFIEEDTACTDGFVRDVGASNLSWTSYKSGTAVAGGTATAENVSTSSTEEGTDTGLVVVCVFVYIGIAILLGLGVA